MATSMATRMPTTRFRVERKPLPTTPYSSRAVSTAATMVFTWVALPVPKTVSTPNREYSTARNCQFLLRPFLM